MKAYIVQSDLVPGIGIRLVFVSFDAAFSSGLKEKFEAIEGITFVYKEACLSDTEYCIHLSKRMDYEDILVAIQEIHDTCELHANSQDDETDDAI